MYLLQSHDELASQPVVHDDWHIGLAEFSNELPTHATRTRRAPGLRVCRYRKSFERSITMPGEYRGAQCYPLGTCSYWI
jgi:hypothetical protein